MQVLLIEPDAVLAATYKQALEAIDARVMIAQGAQEAMFAIDEALPDVIVMEMQLPGSNGIAFLQELRSYGDLTHIPVIIHAMHMPQNARTVKAIMARDFGVHIWLYKPKTTIQALQQAVMHQTTRASQEELA